MSNENIGLSTKDAEWIRKDWGVHKANMDKVGRCDCEDWNKSEPQILAAQTLAWTHRMEYSGAVFKYCPWCGKELKVDESAEHVLVSDTGIA